MTTPDFESIKIALKAARSHIDPCATRNLADYMEFYKRTLEMVENAFVKANITASKQDIEQATIKLFREALELEGPAGDIEKEKETFRYFS